MKPGLHLRLSQHLALTPQLQQSIRLLQLSTLELGQEIEGLLESNPFLESEEGEEGGGAQADAEPQAAAEQQPAAVNGAEVATRGDAHDGVGDAGVADAPATSEMQLDAQEWGATAGDADPGANTDLDSDPWSGSSRSAGSADDGEFDALDLASQRSDLRDHLRAQLAGLPLSRTDRAAAEAIIDSLDDDGYFTDTPEELALALAPDASPEELDELIDMQEEMHAVGVMNRLGVSAFAAVVLCDQLGCDLGAVKSALGAFKGIGRRLERVGALGGVTVIDDYAHHPVEIRAVLAAACEGGQGRVIAVMQPHRYSRLGELMDDFAQAFNDADAVLVTPVYAAGEQPVEGFDAETLVANIRRRGHRSVATVDGADDLAQRLADMIRPGDQVICLGAGDITKWAAGLADAIASVRTEAAA